MMVLIHNTYLNGCTLSVSALVATIKVQDTNFKQGSNPVDG